MRKFILSLGILTLGTLSLHAAGSLVLTPTTTTVFVCLENPAAISMDLFNDGSGDSSISLSYSTITGSGSLTGPSMINVADNEHGSFEVQIVPDEFALIGDSFVAKIRASNSTVTGETGDITVRFAHTAGWTTADNNALGTRFHGAAYLSGKIYRIGGDLYTDGNHIAVTGTTRVYSLSSASWSDGPAMPDPAYGAGTAVLGDSIYVIGGSDCADDPHDGCNSGSYFQTVRIFDTSGSTWSTDSPDPLPLALAYPTILAEGGKIYVFGGLDSTAHSVNSVWIYDPDGVATHRWSAGASMSKSRAQAAGAAISGLIYIAGGWEHGSLLLDDLDIYDPIDDSWTTGPSMPVAFSSSAGVALDNRFFYLPSNERVSSTYPNTNYSYGSRGFSFDRMENLWFEESGPLFPVYGTQIVGSGSQAWLVSGRERPDLISYAMSTRIDEGEGCPTSTLIYADGFESADFSAWSGSTL